MHADFLKFVGCGVAEGRDLETLGEDPEVDEECLVREEAFFEGGGEGDEVRSRVEGGVAFGLGCVMGYLLSIPNRLSR